MQAYTGHSMYSENQSMYLQVKLVFVVLLYNSIEYIVSRKFAKRCIEVHCSMRMH